MFRNFVKRAIAIPLIVVFLLMAFTFALAYLAPSLESEAEQPDYSMEFDTKSFDKFTELKAGYYVGELSVKEKGYTAPITYAESISNALVLLPDSKEPWKGNNVYVTGNSTDSQLGILNDLKVGDTVYFNVYTHEKLEYEIVSVTNCMTLNEIVKIKGDDMLVLCRAYNDFSNLSASYLYAVYTAQRV